MKERLLILPMKALAAFALMLGLMPVCILLGCSVIAAEPLWWVLPPACAWLVGVGIYFLPLKSRALCTAAAAAAFAAVFVLAARGKGLGVLALCAPCLVILFMLPPAWSAATWEEWPSSLWLSGAVIHVIGLFLCDRPAFLGTGVYIKIAFVLYAFLLLLFLNRSSLKNGMHNAMRAPAALRIRNTLLLIVLFAVGLAAAFWGRLAAWLNEVWQLVKGALKAVIAWITSLIPDSSRLSGQSGIGGGDGFGMEEAGEPSWLVLLLEKIAMVLAYILAAAIAVWALWFLFKRLKKLIKTLLDKLNQYAMRSGEEYTDEEESTLNWEEKSKSFRERLQKRIAFSRQPAWESLDARQKIRRLYQQLLKRHPEWKMKTAREALTGEKPAAAAPEFAALYELARYSDHDISPEDAEKMKSRLQ